MRHYIEVRWKAGGGPPVRTLVNLTRLVTVVDDPKGCKVHMQGFCLEVADSFDDVMGRIEAAEAERVFDPKRKLAFRFGEEEPGESSSIAAAAAMRSIPPSSDDGGG